MSSRWLIAASLVAALTSSVFASEQQFAAPPPPVAAARADLPPPDAFAPIEVTRDAVRAKLVQARADNLARFRAYQKAGVFPSNTFRKDKLNVWRDSGGHLCAAATIINASGATDLVNRVAEQTNFIRLADVKQGPLMDWILTSGMTQEEISAIQEPYMPVYKVKPVVEPDLRMAENRRLIQRYKTVDAQIVQNEQRSLDTAVDRLMKHPQLASSFVNH